MKRITIHFINNKCSNIDSRLLRDEDLEVVNKFSCLEAKREKTISLALIRKYIGDYYLGEYGKPLSKEKEFNISHSKGAVVLVIDEVPVGIDIEQIRPVDEKLKDYISNEEENRYIKDEQTFYEVWTNKESLLKAIGTGIRGKLKEIPGLPINGVRNYQNRAFKSKTIIHQGYVITLTRESLEDFDIDVIEENL